MCSHEACDSAPRGFSRCGAACSSSDAGLTNDQQKVNDTIAMLRLYRRNQSRFFLGVGHS
jgi:hypothetical protein